jgi:hypothetical protein
MRLILFLYGYRCDEDVGYKCLVTVRMRVVISQQAEIAQLREYSD